MEYTHAAIARRYLRGWFVPDFISSIPTSFIILFAGAESLGEHRFFLRVLRFVRLFKLVKLVRFKEKVARLAVDAEDEHLRSTLVAVEGVLNTLKYILMLLYLAHLLTCCWYAAGCTTEWDDDDGLMEGWVVQEGWYESEGDLKEICLDGQSVPDELICSECVALDRLSAVEQEHCGGVLAVRDIEVMTQARHSQDYAAGSIALDNATCDTTRCQSIPTDCDPLPSVLRRYLKAFVTSVDGSATLMGNVQMERLYTVVQLLIYQVFFGFLTATIASSILEGNQSRQRYEDKIQSVQEFCQTTSIRGGVRAKIIEHFRNAYPNQAIIDHSAIIPELPPWLRQVRHLSVINQSVTNRYSSIICSSIIHDV